MMLRPDFNARAEGPEALSADAPSLIEVPVGMMPTPFT